jgi:hypothetical protein
MTGNINVEDLSEEQIAALEKLVEIFRKQSKGKKKEKPEKETFIFEAHPSNVIGELTRKTIYEDR